ncbi:hypothetical protein [Flavihumibacter petaseus]|nr:hypothetical protein [Flavihumibacter petaseus]
MTEQQDQQPHLAQDGWEAYHAAAKWARFLAWIGFALLAIMLFAAVWALRLAYFTPRIQGINKDMISMAMYFGWSSPVIAMLYIFPVWLLYRFSRTAIRASRQKDIGVLRDSFQRLHAFFRYIGILMIVFLGIYLLFFIIAGTAAMLGLGEQ